MSIDVQKFNDDVWDLICSKVKNSAVFLDNHAAECLHWNGGVMKLLNAGAVAVKEFSCSESGLHGQEKAMFLTCSPIVGDLHSTMETVIRASNFSSCTAVTGAGKTVHTVAHSSSDKACQGASLDDPFVILEAEMKNWMQQKISDPEKVVEATVLSMPLFAINFGGEKNHILLTPPFAHLFPTLKPEALREHKPAMSYPGKKNSNSMQSQTVMDDTSLNKNTRISVVHLADSLHRLLYKMGGRAEVYAMGHFSNLVAGEISRRRAQSWSNVGSHGGEVGLDASLVLVDRTLDLATPCSHGSFALLDRIMATLPHLPGHTTDVAVNMTPLCHPKKNGIKVVGFPSGCLAHSAVPGEKIGGQGELLDLLAGGRRQKEVILGLHRQIMSAAISFKVRSAAPKAERITPKVIETLVEEFADRPEAVRSLCTLLQHGLCVSQALAHPISQVFDYMSGAEKVLLQSLSLEDGKATVASDKTKEILLQVEMMIRSFRDRGFTINAILALLIHLFALPLAPVEYDSLKDAIREALLDNLDEDEDEATKGSFTLDDHRSSLAAHNVFKVLESIAKAREGLKKYRMLYSQEYSQRTVTLRPLLAQLAADIFNPSSPPIPDLVCVTSSFGHSAGIKGLLRSSLGQLMSAARSTPPGDAKMVLVFVIGGITGEEVRLIREALWSVKDKAALAAAPKTVLIGGTRILTPDDVLCSVFAENQP